MANPTTQAAVERLSKDSTRLKASAGYCSHDGTPRSEDNTRWNAAFATDIDTVLADHATQAARIAELEKAAREGLICAEADLETQRQSCIENGEDPEGDQFYQVFKARRDLIKDALDPFADRVAEEIGINPLSDNGLSASEPSKEIGLAPPAAVAEQTGEGQ